jgi:Esterase-like activity of phytase
MPTRIHHRLISCTIALSLLASTTLSTAQKKPSTPQKGMAASASGSYFNRISYFAAVNSLPADRDRTKKSVAEIVAASEDGMMLAYTDGEQSGVGLVDIKDPTRPQAAGFIPVDGEPTSVVITSGKVLVAVSTTKDFAQPDGNLTVIDLASKRIIERCKLYGQPDSVTLDAQAKNIIIAIENERDEKVNKGEIPQTPAGNVSIIPLNKGMPDCTKIHPVSMEGIAGVAPTDPEPEYVKVNAQGIAVVSLQENNHIALIDVAKRQVVGHFSAGKVSLKEIDRKRNGQIQANESANDLLREPDTVVWLDNERFVSANEGDYKGGSRGFTIFNKDGKVEYDSGNFLEHEAMRLGHYPEHRSQAKGAEPEGAEVGVFGKDRLIFIAAERASLLFVFQDMGAGKAPKYLQALPTGTAPEGVLAIPSRNLVVVASEADGAARSGLMLYARNADEPAYPTIMSSDTAAGPPIPWGAISGITADRKQANRFWAVTDSVYSASRILQIDTATKPALISNAITLTKAGQPAGFDAEGIAQRVDGSFWISSEGDPDKKEGAIPNLLLRVSAKGEVQEEIGLPPEMAKQYTRFGFEGVTVTGEGANEVVWLVAQREWKDDPAGFVKILRYLPATKAWSMLHYPLEKTTEKGAWLGLSEITATGPESFVVIERDNRFGSEAIKTLHSFSVAGLQPVALGSSNVPVVKKQLLRNLQADLQAPKGYVLDKVESFGVDIAGNAIFITDNDGVDGGSNGETQLVRLGKIALPR